ncbi:uncharacterized protein CLUP02_15365 [Colletotrichum lupini]|uniref:Uncharacterized protein n=1 Tax=Colletotrichum lupini TaxID=145971 RepID=A0A9Q8T5T8_9PEZI|nr:uncharacterized protein CLUP02_15365 [Colletotrichum lupini]UQC89834.1 hypothetical protein CLUP02_15365 [Colletotrichum lupini]
MVDKSGRSTKTWAQCRPIGAVCWCLDFGRTDASEWSLHYFSRHPAISVRTEIVDPGSKIMSPTNDGFQILLFPRRLLRIFLFSKSSVRESERETFASIVTRALGHYTVPGSPDEGSGQWR